MKKIHFLPAFLLAGLIIPVFPGVLRPMQTPAGTTGVVQLLTDTLPDMHGTGTKLLGPKRPPRPGDGIAHHGAPTLNPVYR